jgi:putative protease
MYFQRMNSTPEIPKYQKTQKLELLAPAGKADCFYAALDAGANAVYLGVEGFNARLRAPNFTLKTLAHLIPYAHSQNVKVYITINTLLKQAEIPDLMNLLFALSQIGADAIIAADIGVITLACAAFPRLAIHASTQMSIHNSAGCDAVAKMGVSRVVLARECTNDEIRAIRHATPMELEVFVHGAVCYSYSGACLASSYFGGQSGNRGSCTQVCRRPFTQSNVTGNFFSPWDLSLIELIPALVHAGVKSLKIEGRMKSPHYVYTVVNAYRRAIDDQANIPALIAELNRDGGRSKTTLFFSDPQQSGIIATQAGSGTGVVVGVITAFDTTSITLAKEAAVAVGDTIRIQPATGFDGESFHVKEISSTSDSVLLHLDKTGAFALGDKVYLTAFHDAYSPKRPKTSTYPARYQTEFLNGRGLIASCTPKPQPSRGSDKLFIKIDSLQWLPLVAEKSENIIVNLDIKQTAQLLANTNQMLALQKKLIFELPQIIPQATLGSWKGVIATGKRRGVNRWMVSNMGARALFAPTDTVYADWSIPALNRSAQWGINKAGCSMFTYSLEDEFTNIRACASSLGAVYLYAPVPLFVSRIRPAAHFDTLITDAHDNAIHCVEKEGIYVTLAKEPLCLTHKRDKLSELGIKSFILDFSFQKPSAELCSSILSHYREKTKVPNSKMVNFKLGLA